jgi:hypothetical protein
MSEVTENLDLVAIMLALKSAARSANAGHITTAIDTIVDVITDIGQAVVRLEDAVFEVDAPANDDEGGSEDE